MRKTNPLHFFTFGLQRTAGPYSWVKRVIMTTRRLLPVFPHHIGDAGRHVSKVPIVLQKSKVASLRIFGEILKREAIDDSYNVSRATEVAYEFSVRRLGPSDLYTKTAPAALGIFSAKRLLQRYLPLNGHRRHRSARLKGASIRQYTDHIHKI
jgi:hypothetical protein